MFQRLWIFLFMFVIGMMALWNVNADKDIIDVEFIACSINVLHQCKCGQNGTLQEVYVESCPVNLNEASFNECLPCPGACSKFSNCSSCSKNRCRTCSLGRTGDFCEYMTNQLSLDKNSMNASRKQNISYMPQDFIKYNKSKLAEADKDPYLSYQDLEFLNSYEGDFNYFLSSLQNIKDLLLQKANISFVDFNNISSLEFSNDKSLLSDIINFALLNGSSESSKKDVSLDDFQLRSFIDGNLEQDFLLPIKNYKKDWIALGLEKKNISAYNGSRALNSEVPKSLHFVTSHYGKLNQDTLLLVLNEEKDSMVKQSENNNAFTLTKMKNKTEPVIFKENSVNISSERNFSKNINLSSNGFKNIARNTLYNNTYLFIDKNDIALDANREESVKNTSPRKVLEKSRVTYKKAVSMNSGEFQGFENSKDKKTDVYYDAANLDSNRGQDSLGKMNDDPNDFLWPNEYHKKISHILSDASGDTMLMNSKGMTAAFPEEEKESIQVQNIQKDDAHQSTQTNVLTQNEPYNNQYKTPKGNISISKMNNNASMTDTKENNSFSKTNINVLIKDSPKEIKSFTQTNNNVLRKDAQKENNSFAQTKNNVSIKDTPKEKNSFGKTNNNVLISNGINSNSQGELSMQSNLSRNTQNNTSREEKLLEVFFSHILPKYYTQDEELNDGRLHYNSQDIALKQDRQFLNEQKKSSMQDKAFSNKQFNKNKTSAFSNLSNAFAKTSSRILNLQKPKHTVLPKSNYYYLYYLFSSPLVSDYSMYCEMYPFDPLCLEVHNSQFRSYNKNFTRRSYLNKRWKDDEFPNFRVNSGLNSFMLTDVLNRLNHKLERRLNYYYRNLNDESKRQPYNVHSYNNYHATQRNYPFYSNQHRMFYNEYPYVDSEYDYDDIFGENNVNYRNYEKPFSSFNYKENSADSFKNPNKIHDVLNRKLKDEQKRSPGMYSSTPLNKKSQNNYNNKNESSVIANYRNKNESSITTNYKDKNESSIKQLLNSIKKANYKNYGVFKLKNRSSNPTLKKNFTYRDSQFPQKHHLKVNKDSQGTIRPFELKKHHTLTNLTEHGNKDETTSPYQLKNNSKTMKNEHDNSFLKSSESVEYSVRTHIVPKEKIMELSNPSKFKVFKSALPLKTYSKMVDLKNSTLEKVTKILMNSLDNEGKKRGNVSLSVKEPSVKRRRRESDDSWCPIYRQSLHGNVECLMWNYKKICWIECHEGYQTSETSFVCFKKINKWMPPISPCFGKDESYSEIERDSRIVEESSFTDAASHNSKNEMPHDGIAFQSGNGIENNDEQYEIVYYDEIE